MHIAPLRPWTLTVITIAIATVSVATTTRAPCSNGWSLWDSAIAPPEVLGRQERQAAHCGRDRVMTLAIFDVIFMYYWLIQTVQYIYLIPMGEIEGEHTHCHWQWAMTSLHRHRLLREGAIAGSRFLRDRHNNAARVLGRHIIMGLHRRRGYITICPAHSSTGSSQRSKGGIVTQHSGICGAHYKTATWTPCSMTGEYILNSVETIPWWHLGFVKCPHLVDTPYASFRMMSRQWENSLGVT